MENKEKQDIDLWEKEQLERNLARIYKISKNYRDPAQEKHLDFRHSHHQYHYNKECKDIRKMTNRLLRRRLHRELLNEAYYRVTSHDYKTGGWLTW